MNVVGGLRPAVEAHLARMQERPARQRTMQKDGTLGPGQMPWVKPKCP